MVTFLHLARPLVLRLAGAAPSPCRASRPRPASPPQEGRAAGIPAGARSGPEAQLPLARKFGREGAGLLTSLTESDAFVELPEDVVDVAPGDVVRVLPFAALF